MGCTTPRGDPWPEIFNLRAAIAGRTLPSPLRIRRSSRNAVIRPRSAASLAVWQRKTIRGVGAPATVRHQHREHLSFAQDAASPQQSLLSPGATAPCSAGIATRPAKGAAAPVAEARVDGDVISFKRVRCSRRTVDPQFINSDRSSMRRSIWE